MMRRPPWILPVIVISQFAGTSLWFAGNAVISDLQRLLGLEPSSLGWMTSSVQLGFIFGTLIFALLSLPDRFSPRHLFFLCSLAGAVANAGIFLFANSLTAILFLRFLTGFFLAGIYPVGMKIAASWYREGLGKAMGYLVGALVLGTSLPHLIRGLGGNWDWRNVLLLSSVIASCGGLLIVLFVPDGPYTSQITTFKFHAIVDVFRSKPFRASAFGYFGHMWELYTLWTFIPLALSRYGQVHTQQLWNVSLLSFLSIAAGTLGCVFGGHLSKKVGSAKVAFMFLAISGLCCLFSFLFFSLPKSIFLLLLLIWGIAVVADSPQYSSLNSLLAPQGLVGTGLTITTCIGFSITIVSIEFLNFLSAHLKIEYLFLWLLPGPLAGLFALRPLLKKDEMITPRAKARRFTLVA